MKAGDLDPSSLSRKIVVYTTSNLGYKMLQHKTFYFSDFLVTCKLFAVCGQSNGLFASELTSVDKDSSLVVENKTSRVIVINGHALPPMPDKTLNDATLLGIESNNNGVRDDVEIWIYQTYKDKHPIYIDIMMQQGRANKLILERPEQAREIHDEVNKAVYCEMYYTYNAKYFNEPLLVQKHITNKYFRRQIYFNTKKCRSAYDLYNSLLSGGSYLLSSRVDEKKACDFNTSKYEQ